MSLTTSMLMVGFEAAMFATECALERAAAGTLFKYGAALLSIEC
jgi:hypothetical protein